MDSKFSMDLISELMASIEETGGHILSGNDTITNNQTAELEEERRKYQDLNDSYAECESKLARVMAQIFPCQQQNDELKIENEALKEQLNSLLLKYECIEKEVIQYRALSGVATEKQEEIKVLKKESNKRKSLLDKTKNELRDKCSEVKALKIRVKHLEKFVDEIAAVKDSQTCLSTRQKHFLKVFAARKNETEESDLDWEDLPEPETSIDTHILETSTVSTSNQHLLSIRNMDSIPRTINNEDSLACNSSSKESSNHDNKSPTKQKTLSKAHVGNNFFLSQCLNEDLEQSLPDLDIDSLKQQLCLRNEQYSPLSPLPPTPPPSNRKGQKRKLDESSIQTVNLNSRFNSIEPVPKRNACSVSPLSRPVPTIPRKPNLLHQESEGFDVQEQVSPSEIVHASQASHTTRFQDFVFKKNNLGGLELSLSIEDNKTQVMVDRENERLFVTIDMLGSQARSTCSSIATGSNDHPPTSSVAIPCPTFESPRLEPKASTLVFEDAKNKYRNLQTFVDASKPLITNEGNTLKTFSSRADESKVEKVHAKASPSIVNKKSSVPVMSDQNSKADITKDAIAENILRKRGRNQIAPVSKLKKQETIQELVRHKMYKTDNETVIAAAEVKAKDAQEYKEAEAKPITLNYFENAEQFKEAKPTAEDEEKMIVDELQSPIKAHAVVSVQPSPVNGNKERISICKTPPSDLSELPKLNAKVSPSQIDEKSTNPLICVENLEPDIANENTEDANISQRGRKAGRGRKRVAHIMKPRKQVTRNASTKQKADVTDNPKQVTNRETIKHKVGVTYSPKCGSQINEVEFVVTPVKIRLEKCKEADDKLKHETKVKLGNISESLGQLNDTKLCIKVDEKMIQNEIQSPIQAHDIAPDLSMKVDENIIDELQSPIQAHDTIPDTSVVDTVSLKVDVKMTKDEIQSPVKSRDNIPVPDVIDLEEKFVGSKEIQSSAVITDKEKATTCKTPSHIDKFEVKKINAKESPSHISKKSSNPLICVENLKPDATKENTIDENLSQRGRKAVRGRKRVTPISKLRKQLTKHASVIKVDITDSTKKVTKKAAVVNSPKKETETTPTKCKVAVTDSPKCGSEASPIKIESDHKEGDHELKSETKAKLEDISKSFEQIEDSELILKVDEKIITEEIQSPVKARRRHVPIPIEIKSEPCDASEDEEIQSSENVKTEDGWLNYGLFEGDVILLIDDTSEESASKEAAQKPFEQKQPIEKKEAPKDNSILFINDTDEESASNETEQKQKHIQEKIALKGNANLLIDDTDEVSASNKTAKKPSKQKPVQKKKRTPKGNKKKGKIKKTHIHEVASSDIKPKNKISVALEAFSNLTFNDSHYKIYCHALTSTLLNPNNAAKVNEAVNPIITYLVSSNRNPMITFMQKKDPKKLIPLVESCIVSVLLEVDSKKRPHLDRIVKRILEKVPYFILQDNLSMYGTAALCRFVTELAKRKSNRRVPFELCCELVKDKHKFSPFLIASIVGVWPEVLQASKEATDSEKMLLFLILFSLRNKPKALSESNWKECNAVINHVIDVPQNVTRDELFNNFVIALESLCDQRNTDQEEFEFGNAISMLAAIEGWQWTKEKILEPVIYPAIITLMQEKDLSAHKVLVSFFSLYADISRHCPDENFGLDYFESYTTEVFGTSVEQMSAIYAFHINLTYFWAQVICCLLNKTKPSNEMLQMFEHCIMFLTEHQKKLLIVNENRFRAIKEGEIDLSLLEDSLVMAHSTC